jgi:hypothetical protein
VREHGEARKVLTVEVFSTVDGKDAVLFVSDATGTVLHRQRFEQ